MLLLQQQEHQEEQEEEDQQQENKRVHALCVDVEGPQGGPLGALEGPPICLVMLLLQTKR